MAAKYAISVAHGSALVDDYGVVSKALRSRAVLGMNRVISICRGTWIITRTIRR